MRIAQQSTFAASKKEPLVDMMKRVRQAFVEAGLGEPAIRFSMTDTPGAKAVSAIDRVVKRHPSMERFLTHRQLAGGRLQGGRMLSNAVSGEPIDPATLEAIAGGIPRSYPFHSVALHFHADVFGDRLIGLPATGHSLPGVLITDNWWVSGRQRALSVYTVVEAQETDRTLPSNPAPVQAVMKALGKASSTVQVPTRGPDGMPALSAAPERLKAVKAVTDDYRARIEEIAAAAQMPHKLASAAEARASDPSILAGPRKPALEATFKPMGYACRGGSGVFHLTRRTAGNLIAELYLDVGTWSHDVSANFEVHGPGFKATLPVPVAPGIFGQYPIGVAAQWQRIVENLAAMVRELDGSFVPDIERAAGPSPAWYQPRI